MIYRKISLNKDALLFII